MDHHRIALLSAACLAVLSASGCAGTSPQAAGTDFPTGRFHNGDTVVVFDPDGTYLGTTAGGEDWVKGRYAVDAGGVTLEDTWESDAHVQRMGTSCKGVAGRYRWSLAGDVLTATLVEDACAGRRQGVDGTPWTRMP